MPEETRQSHELHIESSVKANLGHLSAMLGEPTDLSMGLHGSGGEVALVFFSSLTNDQDLKANLLAPVIQLAEKQLLTVESLERMIPQTEPKRVTTLEDVAAELLEGKAVLFLAGADEALSYNTQGWAKRVPKEPESERVIRGPREGFTESLDENIGMIRRWLKDSRLRADRMQLGRRTKTRIAVMYLSDIARPGLVKEVHRRLAAIDIDGVIESGYIEQLIKDRRASIFPLTQNTERTDKVAAAILEGRVAIVVDKSPFAIIVPVTVNELYQSAEDYYFDFWLGSFLRIIRLLGNNLAVALPGLYVALVAINPELLPTQTALAIASARARIPIPLIAEVFLLELVVEVFREAGLRLPGTVGETLGISAGVVLGFVGVQSGLVSPVTLVVVAITAIASFTGPSFSVGVTWRLLKYLLLFAGAALGLYGLTLAGMAVLIHAADIKSFGVSYLAPWSPLQWRELADAPIRAPFWFRWLRPKMYRPRKPLRSGGTRAEDDENE